MNYLAIILLAISLSAYSQDRLEALEKRIQELEDQQEELLLKSADRPKVNSFLNDNLTLGGFFEPAYTVISGPDTDFQSTGSSFTLGLNIAAEYSPKLKFVSQILTGLAFNMANPHNDPDGTPDEREFKTLSFGAIVSQGYLEYAMTSHYRVQGGVGYVPFGYSFQQRELVLFARRGGPQMLRTNDLVNPLWTGVNFLADFPKANHTWGYSLYTANHLRSPSRPGAGGRVYYSGDDDVYTIGLSSQVGKKDTVGFTKWGTDFRYKKHSFNLVTEFAESFTKGTNIWSAYVEPGMYAYDEKILFYIFGDYAFNSKNETGATLTTAGTPDPFQKWEYGGGVNWFPATLVRLRLGVTYYDYVGSNAVKKDQNRDYIGVDVSAGVAF